jgi:hypothetical protein
VFQILGEEKLTLKAPTTSDVTVQIFKMQLKLYQVQEDALQHRKLVFSRGCLCWRHRRFGLVDKTAFKQLGRLERVSEVPELASLRPPFREQPFV